jgi:hypothetical protein
MDTKILDFKSNVVGNSKLFIIRYLELQFCTSYQLPAIIDGLCFPKIVKGSKRFCIMVIRRMTKVPGSARNFGLLLELLGAALIFALLYQRGTGL